MIFAQFYKLISASHDVNLYEKAQGNDATAPMAPQFGFTTARLHAAALCKERGFDAWALCRRRGKDGVVVRLTPHMPA